MLAFGEHLKARVHACVGGTSLGGDMKALQSGVHIVSGTPGRVNDMISRRELETKDIKVLVIDEADEMLAQNFKTQLYDCYRCLPPQTQIVLISATISPEILQMTKKFMNDPIKILGQKNYNSHFFFYYTFCFCFFYFCFYFYFLFFVIGKQNTQSV